MKHEYRTLLIMTFLLGILPWVLPNRYFLTVAVIVGIYTLIVIGLNLLIGYAGQISLGHAAFYGLGAYTAAILATHLHWPPLLSLVGAMLLVALVAWLIGKPTLKLQGHYLAMATLGFGLVIQILIEEMVELTGGPLGLSNIPKFAVAGFTFSNDFRLYFVIWSAVLVVQLLVINLTRGKIGRAFFAIHSNEPAAASLGVDTARLKLAVFVMSAVLAGLAGSFYAFSINYLSPEPFGFGFSVLLVTMVMVGGMGNLWGPILGTAILGILPEILRSFKDFDIVVYGLLLIIIVIYMPQGTISMMSRLKKLKFWPSTRANREEGK